MNEAQYVPHTLEDWGVIDGSREPCNSGIGMNENTAHPAAADQRMRERKHVRGR